MPPRNSATTIQKPLQHSWLRWPMRQCSSLPIRKLRPTSICASTRATSTASCCCKSSKIRNRNSRSRRKILSGCPSFCMRSGRSRTSPPVGAITSSTMPRLHKAADMQAKTLSEAGVQAYLEIANAGLDQRDRARARAAPLLQVAGVTIEYRTDERRVLATHNVSFDVHRGDRFVMLGPSSCGKSTLLKAIAGFIAPHAGNITLDGTIVTHPGPDRIVVFQEFDQLPPWKTVRENVMFPLLASKELNRREAGRRADAWLEKVGLSAFAKAHPHTLSGGMKQRVAIARALAMQPA